MKKLFITAIVVVAYVILAAPVMFVLMTAVSGYAGFKMDAVPWWLQLCCAIVSMMFVDIFLNAYTRE